MATAMAGPGAAVLATLRTLALNLLALHGHQSVRAGLAAVAHDIGRLLAMAGIRPGWATGPDFQSALGGNQL